MRNNRHEIESEISCFDIEVTVVSINLLQTFTILTVDRSSEKLL